MSELTNMIKKREITDYKSGFCYAIRLISMKDYTSKMIKDKLVLRGLSQDIADEIINELEDKGYINNEDYARKYIEDCCNLNKKGRKYIEFELIKRGFSKEEVDFFIKECYNSNVDDAFLRILSKYGKKYSELDIKEKNSIKNKLLRQGYVWEEIQTCLSKED